MSFSTKILTSKLNRALAVAVEGVKLLVESGNIEEAHEQMDALSSFFVNLDGSGSGDYFKAMEEIEVGRPDSDGVYYLDQLIEYLKAGK